MVQVDCVVIGAGQAGLSAAYHLQRAGFVPLGESSASARGTYVVLDAEEGPGGAWRHRWHSLRMATVNRVSDLPGITQPEVDPCEPSSEFVSRYFAEYEQQLQLAIVRPVKVRSVRRLVGDTRENDDGGSPQGSSASQGATQATTQCAPRNAIFELETTAGSYTTRGIINATGTWTKPFWPIYPGQSSFRGRQLHVANYVSAKAFHGQRVAVVGGGISAVQLLAEISLEAQTYWFTRREPDWREEEFTAEAGAAAVALVDQRVRQGLAPQSVVSVTGLRWTAALREAKARGVMNRLPMFTSIEPEGVRTVDGKLVELETILWATGFRAELDHLAPLHLREPGGGIVMDGTQVVKEPRVQLVGYGPSSSTIGANRAGRAAVSALLRQF
ncbi:MAG: NAD(P)/FAD-dependent oxidoreductase [Acidobacteria bacterium]|nr:NAD(P)/FAD-dependent oxidoreductase [Acidobacteriota bacterium]